MKRFRRGGSSAPVMIRSGEVAEIPVGEPPRMLLGPPFVSAVLSIEHNTALTPPTAR